jgi:hypothetical protein
MKTNSFEEYSLSNNSLHLKLNSKNQELIKYYKDWIQIKLKEYETYIINKYKSPSLFKEEYKLIKIFRESEHIVKANITFKLDWESKRLNRYEIVESTNEHLLNSWLSTEKWEITTIKNNWMIQWISRTIKWQF